VSELHRDLRVAAVAVHVDRVSRLGLVVVEVAGRIVVVLDVVDDSSLLSSSLIVFGKPCS
jgi:hypothetical protein